MDCLKRKDAIVYRIETEISGGQRQFTTTHLRIELYGATKVADQIYFSCVDPGYYGNPEPYQQLAVGGFDTYYYNFHDKREFNLSYLHASSPGNYCAHKITDIAGGLDGLKWAAKLLTKLSRQVAKNGDHYYEAKDNYSWALDNPQGVADALDSIGAIQIEYTKVQNDNWTESKAVKRFSAPHKFMQSATN